MIQDSWGPIVGVVDSVLDRLDTITDDAVARIRTELADFALVPYDEHRKAVREQLRRRLVAFGERRTWNQEDLGEVRALGQRRARQAISLDVVIRAYHIGDRELWRHLSVAPGEVQTLLPELASLMLESLQAVTSSLAKAHGSETRARDRVQMAVSQRLIDLLSSDTLDGEAERLTEYLGFDPARPFVGLAYVQARAGSDSAVEAGPALTDAPVIARGGIGAVHVLVIQAEDPTVDKLVETLTDAAFSVGIGSGHVGVSGAAQSLRQAQLALSTATARNAVSLFGEDWLINCVTSLADVLDPEVHHAARAADANPALRDTVTAFAEADMSITHCARASHLHANTVVYRLGRWRELTGWDPRTFAGLTRSYVACVLAGSAVVRPEP